MSLALSPLDEHFARLIVALHGHDDAELAEAARTVSAWRTAGHTCVPLAQLETSLEKLRSSPVVGAPGDFKPLIIDAAGRLYLQRYWQYEHDLARALQERLETPARFNAALLEEGLRNFFQDGDDDQRRAAETAVKQRFCLITGGPGTGKTHTIVIVLALLHAQTDAAGAPFRVALAAPTGKAASRMNDAIRMALQREPALASFREKLSTDATTIHRLLGTTPDSPFFRHDATRPLVADVVVIDEASMVDLALMSKLVAAVPESARLIFLGDKDQLASVEAGSVLGDLCNTAGTRPANAPIAAHIVELKRNYRFGNSSTLYQLSQLVKAGDADGALALLAVPKPPASLPQQTLLSFEMAPSNTDPETATSLGRREQEGGSVEQVCASPLPSAPALGTALRDPVVTGFRRMLEAEDPREVLAHLDDFRILCALRRGPFGVANLNQLAEAALADAGLIDPAKTYYRGRPIVVLENDYQLRLFNGDTGVLLPDDEAGGQLRAWFRGPDKTLRRLLPARLPAHETVFATTVHKSQGSEFGRVLFLLPSRDAPVLTRELLYTGLTRAREFVELWHHEPLLRLALARRVERSSGLSDLLWPAAGANPQ